MSTKKKTQPAAEDTAAEEKKIRAVTTEPLNFRVGPSIKADAVRILGNGEAVFVQPEAEENGYVPAETEDGAAGFVDKRYIRVI